MEPKEIVEKLNKLMEKHPDVDKIYCVGMEDHYYETFSRLIENIRYEPTLYFDEETEWTYNDKEEWLEDNYEKSKEECEKLDWESAIVLYI